MNEVAGQPPRKLFREEAKSGAINCPNCGGPVTLKGFGAIERVNCPYCGSTLDPGEHGSLELAQAAQRQRRKSALPLHARGTLDEIEWEIIGIQWREARVDGLVYPWQEFLLFNPWEGFRYLIYSMTDGQWSIGVPLDGAPQIRTGLGHRTCKFKGKSYKHFADSPAVTVYVEGEFTWQVEVGDHGFGSEFIAPPRSISVETSQSEGGSELNFTELHYIAPKAVWKAFKQEGAPPPVTGVSPNQPNPYAKGKTFYRITFVALLIAWVVGITMYLGGLDKKVVFQESGIPIAEPISEEVTVGEIGTKGSLEVEFYASPLDNGWAYAEIMLVNTDTEEAMAFGAEVDHWSGVTDGESWTEGTNPRRVTMGGIDGGTYVLQVVPQFDPKAKIGPTTMSVKVTQDVPLLRYIFLPLFFIVLFPLINWGRRALFETRRWANSDYTGGE